MTKKTAATPTVEKKAASTTTPTVEKKTTSTAPTMLTTTAEKKTTAATPTPSTTAAGAGAAGAAAKKTKSTAVKKPPATNAMNIKPQKIPNCRWQIMFSDIAVLKAWLKSLSSMPNDCLCVRLNIETSMLQCVQVETSNTVYGQTNCEVIYLDDQLAKTKIVKVREDPTELGTIALFTCSRSEWLSMLDIFMTTVPLYMYESSGSGSGSAGSKSNASSSKDSKYAAKDNASDDEDDDDGNNLLKSAKNSDKICLYSSGESKRHSAISRVDEDQYILEKDDLGVVRSYSKSHNYIPDVVNHDFVSLTFDTTEWHDNLKLAFKKEHKFCTFRVFSPSGNAASTSNSAAPSSTAVNPVPTYKYSYTFNDCSTASPWTIENFICKPREPVKKWTCVSKGDFQIRALNQILGSLNHNQVTCLVNPDWMLLQSRIGGGGSDSASGSALDLKTSPYVAYLIVKVKDPETFD